jgi:hypothetical protein
MAPRAGRSVERANELPAGFAKKRNRAVSQRLSTGMAWKGEQETRDMAEETAEHHIPSKKNLSSCQGCGHSTGYVIRQARGVSVAFGSVLRPF